MDLSRIRIVLSHPEESRNIGAVCRAMANSGIKKLRIVGKKEDYDDVHVRTLAVHAVSVWEAAEFFDTITAATADCSISAGTTRRKGKKRKAMLLLPEEFARQYSNVPDSAVVFGNERAGLTDEELAECTIGITIPSDEAFPSLNLSHAVQIICYFLFRETEKRSPGYTPITLARLDTAVETIANDLHQIGFFTIAGRPDMEHFWRTILARAALSESECRYIENVFNKAAGLASKNVSQNQRKITE